MSGKRYTEEFKAEAVRQVTERGHPAREVAARLGVSACGACSDGSRSGGSRPRRGRGLKAHEHTHAVRRLCRILDVHPGGYYARRRAPHLARALDDRRLLGRIKRSWRESGGVYGYRKVADDMSELGECCGKHRVARLMRA